MNALETIKDLQLQLAEKELAIFALVENYENYIRQLKEGRRTERKFRQEQYYSLFKRTS